MKYKNSNTTKCEIIPTKKFLKQYKKIKKQGKNLNKLKEVIELLANGESLGYAYRDHALLNYSNDSGYRECHIEPDWLLIYQLVDEKLILYLIATGSHSDLFK